MTKADTWNTLLTAEQIETKFASTAKLDPAYAKEQREFYQTRSPKELRALALQCWLCNDAEYYQLTMSYEAIKSA